MKNIRFRRLVLIAIAICLFVPGIALADRIDSIDIDGTINKEDGSITLVQTWEASPDSGTEFFIPMTNLNDLEIVNFKVSDEDGPYELMDPWDVDASFEEKARKYGINYTDDGLELCFGKSEFKNKTYKIEFTYKNAVESYEDYDGFNIRFINDKMDPAPSRFNISLEVPGTDLNSEISKVWAFGYNGPVGFEDGKIVASSEDFGSSNYANIMASLEKGIVNPTITRSGDFDDLVNEAFVGSDYSYEDYKNGGTYEDVKDNSAFTDKFFPGLGIFMAIFGISTAIFSAVSGGNNKNIKNARKVDKKNPEYYREIPFEKDLASNFYANSGHENMVENIITATFLKWLRDGYIDFIDTHEKSSILGRDVERYNIVLNKEPEFSNKYEEMLFSSLEVSAIDDNIVTEKEYKKYLKNDDEFIDNLVDKIEDEGETTLTARGYIEDSGKRFKKKNFTEKGLKEAANIYAFKRFLKDFTLIHERTPIEVNLWDEILIGATLFGVGEETLEKFKEFYPDYNFGNSEYDIYHSYLYLNHFSNNTYKSAIANSSSSAGFGGGASMGGGGGFSGGGSGGGGR